MEKSPSDFLMYRTIFDMVLAAILVAVILLYLWALTVGPVSALDPAPPKSPSPRVLPAPEPVPPAGNGAALV